MVARLWAVVQRCLRDHTFSHFDRKCRMLQVTQQGTAALNGGGAQCDVWLPGYSVPGKEAKSVCVCLFVHSHILGTSCPNLIKFSLDVACGCGLVFLCRRYDRLYTTGFVGDDMFARNLSGKGDASRMPTRSESPGDRARWRISKLA